MLTVDARGLSCPEPVMLMLDAIGKTTEPVVVLVDNATARGNVSHMAEERGRKVTITEEGGDFRLLLEWSAGSASPGWSSPSTPRPTRCIWNRKPRPPDCRGGSSRCRGKSQPGAAWPGGMNRKTKKVCAICSHRPASKPKGYTF